MTSSARAQDENLVRSWGFSTVFTWRDEPDTYYPPHSHNGLTTHLIRHGTLTIAFPKDGGAKKMYGPGSRIDVDAGQLHEVWIGYEGCEYVIGE
ncbi:uncharacterized protein CIMG_02344 [Coccidioides immitis RS]|uniref:AraC-type arabinose-binding/dimerisation domain-containing protein n=1 Tax=Coccidioides immitis (strain RS) TaxID=246410 RepID=J3KL62_COCIM|nr:uncharacterized protein CIMG_02344 [Coccidioides immitis RS]EAS36990.3 hypothetical protein CIMG_02344 [Coccidioides immitis RS]QVM06289.1 hypothetical protein D8B26_001001 [Coccidioides posadasii str. Silveira]TPX24973.1 hypothetical protein DIZ76_010422 [Coccidioides immitis]